jgi:hypothetical protein
VFHPWLIPPSGIPVTHAARESGLINRKERREHKEERSLEKFSWNLRGSSRTSRTFSPAIPPLRLRAFAPLRFQLKGTFTPAV